MPITITIPAQDRWNEEKECFETIGKDTTITLEHSLLSLDRWESKHKKPFLGDEKKTKEETVDYIRCMTITKGVDPRVYQFLTDENARTVNDYIKDPMTASWISEKGDSNPRKIEDRIITSELLYYWMFELNIWPEFEKRHLNKLIMQIKVCNSERSGGKKMTKRETAQTYRDLNAKRRAEMHTKG